jgi:hypothetical protein
MTHSFPFCGEFSPPVPIETKTPHQGNKTRQSGTVKLSGAWPAREISIMRR